MKANDNNNISGGHDGLKLKLPSNKYMVGEVFNEKDDENDSEEENEMLMKRKASVNINVQNTEEFEDDHSEHNESGGMVNLGKGSSDNGSLND